MTVESHILQAAGQPLWSIDRCFSCIPARLRVLRVMCGAEIRDAFVLRSARVRSRAELYAPSSSELGW